MKVKQKAHAGPWPHGKVGAGGTLPGRAAWMPTAPGATLRPPPSVLCGIGILDLEDCRGEGER